MRNTLSTSVTSKLKYKTLISKVPNLSPMIIMETLRILKILTSILCVNYPQSKRILWFKTHIYRSQTCWKEGDKGWIFNPIPGEVEIIDGKGRCPPWFALKSYGVSKWWYFNIIMVGGVGVKRVYKKKSKVPLRKLWCLKIELFWGPISSVWSYSRSG